MSRVANKSIPIPKGVEVKVNGANVSVKGPKGELTHVLPRLVQVEIESNILKIKIDTAANEQHTRGYNVDAMAGTSRALLSNFVTGVSEGFTKQLELRGVGYRAQMQGKVLNLTLGFSHPVNYVVPAGITITTPSQTSIVVQGLDKQLVGQVSADIRGYRPPEPYKGKGIRYVGENVIQKETKKK